MYALLGQVQLSGKDYAAAEQSLTKALDINANNVEAILLLTSAQTGRGSIPEAVASYQRAIRQDPRDIRAHILLGSLEESLGNWQDAQQEYQKALPIHRTTQLRRIILLTFSWSTAAMPTSPCPWHKPPADHAG